MHSSCYKYKDAAKIMSRLTRAQASSNLPARSMSPIPRRAPAICLISSSNRLTARTRLPSNTSGANANTSAKRCPRAHPAHASISSGLMCRQTKSSTQVTTADISVSTFSHQDKVIYAYRSKYQSDVGALHALSVCIAAARHAQQ
eukprot:GHRR01035604.1.p1 GENE.GHRR01035604.1~~GHRR01035604.1.p1  ORF type:complete len:145 (-),score=28.73 GHRR01035604.1:29-463(-)